LPITINWINLASAKTSNCYKLSLPMGNLMVYQLDGVIIKTAWSFDNIEGESFSKSKLCDNIQQYLNNPSSELEVKLKKQDSDFRHQVWTEICRIPMGQVATYSDVAKEIGSGARAVASACRHNAFPGIIPCHRVVAKSGLGGYTGETKGQCMDIKIALLAMESK
jgi:methylated-DNA-[protein]-cysteine S-methyltransferase